VVERLLLVVSDRPLVVQLLAELARSSQPSFCLQPAAVLLDVAVRAAATGATAALVDLAPDPLAGLRVCQALRSAAPSLPLAALLCCSRAATPWQVQALVEIGVSGLLSLDAPVADLVQAFGRLAEGALYLHARVLSEPPRSTGQRPTSRSDPSRTAVQLLTGSDAELLQLLTRGFTDEEIGRVLHLSRHTVSHRVERLCRALGLRNRTALAGWAGRQGYGARAPADGA
jgi:DNA-binding NarL/FixJ family response regulator